MRRRAELLTHVQNTNRPYNLPEMGRKIAYKTNRDGVAERFADPAVPTSLEVDLALSGHYDERPRDGELSILKAAKQHDANTLYLLRTVPGIGEIRKDVEIPADPPPPHDALLINEEERSLGDPYHMGVLVLPFGRAV